MNNNIMKKIFPLLASMIYMTSCTPGSMQVSAAPNYPITKADQRPFNYFCTAWLPSPLIVTPYLRCVYQDKAGNYWFGTDGKGVCCYDGKCYTNFTTKDGLISDYVTAIREDVDGLWITTNMGVSHYNGVFFKNFPGKNGKGGC